MLYQKSVDVRTRLGCGQDYLWEMIQILNRGGILFIVEGTRTTDNGSVIDSDDTNSLDEDSNG